MKIRTILLTVLMTLIIASAAFADEITYFTCDSDPADFNGKTFDKLFVLLDGCKNFDSTIIPGEDAFVTLDNITVNGKLYFLDDHYDRTTDTLIDAEKSDTTKHGDTYLNLTGKSHIERIQTQCVYNHDCNLGIPYPTRVEVVEAYLMNNKANGKTVLRGKIDPFIDENTDYYHDEHIASFPEFNVNTFDLDLIKAAPERIDDFIMASYGAGIYSRGYRFPYGLRFFFNSGLYDPEIMNIFERGYIDCIYLGDAFDFKRGDVEIDLANIEVGALCTEGEDSAETWVPEIISRGYTTIGMFSTNSSFKTGVYASAPYSLTTTDINNIVLPLYIDLMVLGGTGRNIRYDNDYTNILVLNYAGNEDPNSLLDLNLGNAGNAINTPSIGIVNIIGGKFDMSCKESVKTHPSIEKLNFYEGIDDYQYGENPMDTLRELYYDRDDFWVWSLRINDKGTGLCDDNDNQAMINKRSESYHKEVDYFNGDHFAKTAHGYFGVTFTFDDMIKPGNTDMSGKSVVSFNGQNLSLGDISVSKNLGSIANWMSGSCNFWQHGETRMDVVTIY